MKLLAALGTLLGESDFTPSVARVFLHLWCVKFLKRAGVLKNQTFFSFIGSKCFYIFHIRYFISLFLACIFFIYTRFENIPKSALVIRKIDSDTGAPLANAWFRVRYLGGTSGSGGSIIGEYATSSNGNIVITGLEAGTYVVEEISAPNGYVMDTAPQTAYISGKEQDCITLTFTNSKYGAVLIKKVDSVTGEPLSDVQFFITTSDGAVIGNSNGYFVTDSAGTILTPDLMPGTTLIVKETRTRPGYILDEVPQTVKIDSNETKTLEFRNQPTGSLLIRKVCAVNPSVTLQNAEFKVTYSDGSVIGDSNGVYRSDENGEVRIDGLTPGRSVIVTETKAPDGFLIDTQSQTIVIQAGKTVTITMKNQPKG